MLKDILLEHVGEDRQEAVVYDFEDGGLGIRLITANYFSDDDDAPMD
jgi:hypothetical protein